MTRKLLSRIAAAAFVWAAFFASALAQTSPNFTFGQVPTPAQWNTLFASKQDYLGAAPCPITGCSFSGKINLLASSASASGINFGQGAAPTSPSNGDVWVTSAGLFARYNGSTVGPMGTGGTNTVTIGGATNSTFTLTNLSMVGSAITAGSMAAQGAGAVAITGGTVAGTSINMTGATLTNVPNPSGSGDAANKSYVDSVAGAGLNPLTQVRLATAAVLPSSPTYANGASGVGATLTAGSNTTLTVDGTGANLADRVLVKTQAAALQNGIFTVTQAGSGSLPWILTRATDFDQAAEQKVNSTTVVTAGSTLAGSSWIMNPAVTTVGTDPQNWTLFAAGGVTSIGGVIGPLTLGTGLSMVGTVITPAANVSSIAAQTGAFTCSSEISCTSATLAFASITANSVLANFTGGAAKPIANSIASCPDTAGNHLNFVSGTGITCGTSACTITTVATNTSLSSAPCQTVLVNAAGGAVTITLFAAGAGVAGQIARVKKIDSSANNVILVVSGGGNIDTVTSQVIGSQGSSITAQPNSSQWYSL